MTCREHIEVLDDYVDNTMPARLRDEFERHLEGCAPCRAFLATYRATRTLGAAAARVEMPEGMKTRLRRLLQNRLRGA